MIATRVSAQRYCEVWMERYTVDAAMSVEMARERRELLGVVDPELPVRPIYTNDAALERSRRREYEALAAQCAAEAAVWNVEARQWHARRAEAVADHVRALLDASSLGQSHGSPATSAIDSHFDGVLVDTNTDMPEGEGNAEATERDEPLDAKDTPPSADLQPSELTESNVMSADSADGYLTPARPSGRRGGEDASDAEGSMRREALDWRLLASPLLGLADVAAASAGNVPAAHDERREGLDAAAAEACDFAAWQFRIEERRRAARAICDEQRRAFVARWRRRGAADAYRVGMRVPYEMAPQLAPSALGPGDGSTPT